MKALGTFLYRVLILLFLWGMGTNIATTTKLLTIQTTMMLEATQQRQPQQAPTTLDPNARIADGR